MNKLMSGVAVAVPEKNELKCAKIYSQYSMIEMHATVHYVIILHQNPELELA
jgi:hypothetical protein